MTATIHDQQPAWMGLREELTAQINVGDWVVEPDYGLGRVYRLHPGTEITDVLFAGGVVVSVSTSHLTRLP